MVSFGIVAAIGLGVVALTATLTAIRSGDAVIQTAARRMDDFFLDQKALLPRLMADIATKKYEALEGLTLLLQIYTQERLWGYPESLRTTERNGESQVPFRDYYNQSRNAYPWKAKNLLPNTTEDTIWNVLPDGDTEAGSEHVHSRRFWYFMGNELNLSRVGGISTVDAVMEMRCDNNDGNCSPPQIALHEQVSDYASPILKSLYESHVEVKSIEIHFVNEEASVTFPGRKWEDRGKHFYTSVGCDWLKQANPLNPSERIAMSAEQFSSCHSAGSKVGYLSFNALEQGWCRDQVLSQDNRMHVDGPLHDEDGFWHIAVGRAIFDRGTRKLIACTRVKVSIAEFLAVDNIVLNGYESYFGVIRWDKRGTVLNATSWQPDPLNQTTISLLDMKELQVTQEKLDDTKRRILDGFEVSGVIPDTSYETDDFYVGFHPFPRVDKEHNGQDGFDPQFLTFFISAKAERHRLVEQSRALVDEEVSALRKDTILACIGGLAFTFIAIYTASLYLTLPLKWIDKVGCQILESAGSMEKPTKGDAKLDDRNTSLKTKPWSYRCAPPSEIAELVDEFHTMIKQFSGKGIATLIKQDLLEVKNPFLLFNKFQPLYDRQSCERTVLMHPQPPQLHLVEKVLDGSNSDETSEEASSSQTRKHYGPNTNSCFEGTTNSEGLVTSDSANKLVWRSRIFWLILLCVTFPLTLSMGAISAFVAASISGSLPSLSRLIEATYNDVRRIYPYYFALLRASHLSSTMAIPMRDLYVFNRVSGWLFSETIPLRDTFTTMTTVAEKCKEYPVGGTCPFASTACDCSWNDPFARTCDSRRAHSRRLQELFFEGLSEDSWPDGSRNSTSFPHQNGLYPPFGLFPNTTSFWDSIDDLPGAAEGINATGHGTTYGRVRTMSAASPVLIPLYNYAKGTRLDSAWGAFMTFAADGMTSGYAGCSDEHAYFAHFRIQQNPSDLCPVGKYGFDGRCKEHYIATERYTSDTTDTPLFVSTTSEILSDNSTRLSYGVLPVMDDSSGELIGQSSVKFQIEDYFFELDKTGLGKGSFRILSKSGRDTGVGDTIHISNDPGRPDSPVSDALKGPGDSLPEVLFPFDKCDSIFEYGSSCTYLAEFNKIWEGIRRGLFSVSRFDRTGSAGDIETINYNFAPVLIRSLRPINSSDFSVGTLEYKTPVFTVSFGQRDRDILEEFSAVVVELERTLRQGVAVLIIVIVCTFVCVSLLAWTVGMSISNPVSRLCTLVTSINRSEFHDELPEVIGGSREVSKVKATFEKLHMLLRAANSAFFTGNLKDAYLTLTDAMRLFRHLGNDKAIGITNNNLGNVMLAFYRAMDKASLKTYAGLSRRIVVRDGCAYFKESIDAGEEAIERINREEGWSEKYLIFMQQLSNRYFNRALFLLSVHRDHPDPDGAVNQGMMDLATCKDMDREVVDNGDRVGFKGDEDVHFELLLSRIKGLLILIENGHEDDWGIEELFEEAKAALQSALRSPAGNFFHDVKPAGQVQRLESVLIEYHLMMGRKEGDEAHVETAATIGIRMLFEDDYVIGEAILLALNALILSISEEEEEDDSSELVRFRKTIAEALSLACSNTDVASRESFAAANTGDFSMEAF